MKTSYRQQPRGWKSYAVATTAALLATLTACTPGLAVRSDIDPGADFSGYRTYNFFDPMGVEGDYNSAEFGEHYRAAISGEMSRRGYKLADRPDLMINVTWRADDKIEIKSYSTPYVSGAYYARPTGAYFDSTAGIGVSTGTMAMQTTEASIFIDLVDFAQQRVVWQGVAVVDVTDKVRKQLRDAIFTSVNKVMAEYPHTAGK